MSLAVVGALLLVLAGTVVAHRWGLPAPVLLPLAGIVVAVLPGVPPVRVAPDLIATVALPPLLYAATLDLTGAEMRRQRAPLAVLTTVVVVLATLAVGVVAHDLLPGVPLSAALVLGALLSATDPVAVAALSRGLALPRRLFTLVQAESLFNDATALVLYQTCLAAAVTGAALVSGHTGLSLLRAAGGGLAVGLAVAVVARPLRRRLGDPALATAFALLTPFVPYVVADRLGASGAVAVVVCGVALSSHTAHIAHDDPAARVQAASVREVTVLLLEGGVFLLVGLTLPGELRDLAASPQGLDVPRLVAQTAVLAVAVLVVRLALVVAATSLPVLRGRGGRAPWRSQLVLAWSGTRGVVALIGALSIPVATSTGGAFPGRELLVVTAGLVVLVSLVVQGLTLVPLTRSLGVALDPAEEQGQAALARYRTAQAGLAALETLVGGDAELPVGAVDRLRAELQDRAEQHRVAAAAAAVASRPDAEPAAGGGRAGLAELRRAVLQAERDELLRLRRVGEVEEPVLRRVLHELDLAEAALSPRGR